MNGFVCSQPKNNRINERNNTTEGSSGEINPKSCIDFIFFWDFPNILGFHHTLMYLFWLSFAPGVPVAGPSI